MIIIDAELKRRAAYGRPVRVGMVGAGFMARGIARTIVSAVPGVRLAAIANRTPERAIAVYAGAGIEGVKQANTGADVEAALSTGKHVVTDNPMLLCRAEGIDAILDSTGAIDLGAQIVLEAVAHGKHVVTNAELNGTIGPLLKTYAERSGVIVTGCDGDQPAVQMNLYRFVKGVGLTPLVCGNIKGMQDRYRTPATQAEFARRNGLTPEMATAFADGTKISLEQAEVANATGMNVACRGMMGHAYSGHIDEMTGMYDVDELRRLGGIVEYALGTLPSPGVYVFAAQDDPGQRTMLHYCKLGSGPLYSFYVPYHLMTFEAHLSLARAVLFRDAAIAPLAGPVVDVVATAKRALRAGESLDGLGGFMTYGLCEKSAVVRRDNLLPIGLVKGCRLTRDVAKDQALSYSDIAPPEDSLIHKLRREQDKLFSPAPVNHAGSIAAFPEQTMKFHGPNSANSPTTTTY